MDEGAQFVTWANEQTTLYTYGICGCSAVIIAGDQGAAATHIGSSHTAAMANPATYNLAIEGHHSNSVNALIARTNGWTNRGALVIHSDALAHGQLFGANRAPNAVAALTVPLQRAGIPVTVNSYSQLTTEQERDTPLYVRSTAAQGKPKNAVWGGRHYNLP